VLLYPATLQRNTKRSKFQPQATLSTGAQFVPPSTLTGSLFEQTLRTVQLLLPLPPLQASNILPPHWPAIKLVLFHEHSVKASYRTDCRYLGYDSKQLHALLIKMRVRLFPYARFNRRLLFSLDNNNSQKQNKLQILTLMPYVV